MRRSLTYFLFASPLLAQVFATPPQQAPIDALIQSYQSALSNGRYDEAAAQRDQARALLSQIPADDPQFANWAQQVSQTYANSGFALQARDVLEQTLARTGGLSESSPVRIALLDALARSWEEDRNLLQAASYLEQAVAAAEMQPAPAPPSGPRGFSAAGIAFSPPMGGRVTASSVNYAGYYQRLLNLYRQMGRAEEAAGVPARVAAHVKDSQGLIASLYQQQGQTDAAAAIYKAQAEQAADPEQAVSALLSLSNLYSNVRRYGEAVAALQEAIGKSEDPGGSLQMRQYLANLLQQAGQTQAAGAVYQQLMAEQTDQQTGIVSNYANFLAQTGRAGQAEQLLNDYQTSHAGAQPWEQNNILMALANVERFAGKPDLAAEYQRRASPSQPPPPDGEVRIGETLQHASQAVSSGKLDEAFNLTLQALDAAPGAVDRESAFWPASGVAGNLAAKSPARADEIYRRLFALAESESAATVSPLLTLLQSYAGALRNQHRWSEFEQAVERYSATLTAARGAGTGWLEDSLTLRASFPHPARLQDALAASQELVKLEESLSGATSEPYLRATETLANAMEFNGDSGSALPLRRKLVTIADLVYGANDMRRGNLRMNAAMADAHAGQFDEAEALAGEAVAISQHMQPPQPRMFTDQFQQILQMKRAAQPSSAAKQ